MFTHELSIAQLAGIEGNIAPRSIAKVTITGAILLMEIIARNSNTKDSVTLIKRLCVLPQ